jgi:hypothetical protein
MKSKIMRKRASQVMKKSSSLLKNGKANGIHPFSERPGEEKFGNKNKKGHISASELFSLFTADIIKEDITFTR